jgi:hypothetical protein
MSSRVVGRDSGEWIIWIDQVALIDRERIILDCVFTYYVHVYQLENQSSLATFRRLDMLSANIICLTYPSLVHFIKLAESIRYI